MKERLHIWTSRDVRLAVPAVALSVLGDAMAMVALTLRVHASGAGPYAVAGLLLCFALPVVLTMGLAGSVAGGCSTGGTWTAPSAPSRNPTSPASTSARGISSAVASSR